MHIASWKTLLKCIKSLKFGQFSSFSSSLAVSCTSCGPVKNSWDKPSSRCVPATGLDELRCDCTAHGTRPAWLCSSPHPSFLPTTHCTRQYCQRWRWPIYSPSFVQYCVSQHQDVFSRVKCCGISPVPVFQLSVLDLVGLLHSSDKT